MPFLLVLPCLLALRGPIARADDGDLESAREFARAELIKEAARAVRKPRSGSAAIDAMQRGLAADIRFAEDQDPEDAQDRARLDAFRKTIAERLLLLGRPPSGEGQDADPGTDGALRETSRLSAWLVGEEPCGIRVQNTGADDETARLHAYPPEPEPAAPGGADGAGPPAPPVDDTAAPQAADPKAADPKAGAPETEAPKAEPPKTAAPAEAKKAPPEPAGPPDVHVWARTVVRPKEGGSLLARTMETVACPRVEALLRAGAEKPVYIHPDAGDVQRHALVADEIFAYNAPLAALRLLQSDERNKAMQSDRPQPSLVDDAMVREKAADVARYGELIERHGKRVTRIRTRLDEMVDHLDAWKTQAALLAGEIAERRRALQPPGEEEPDAQVEARDLSLRLAQARETLATLDISLLFQAAVRARDRLELLGQLTRAASEEHTAAEQVHIRYSMALTALRSTRRLDRLRSDSRSMQRWIAAEEADTPSEGSTGAKRLAAYRALLDVNAIVQEAVRRRRLIAPGGASSRREPSEDGETDREDEAAVGEGPRLSALVLEPRKASWDLKYVEIARRELVDPRFHDVFDASLVADHFTAVSDRIGALVDAYQISRDEDRLRTEFETASADAEAALGQLRYDVLTVSVRKLPLILSAANEDFAGAMDGIAEQRAQNRERLDALVGYRRLLIEQGTRSLLIRIDRSVTDPTLGEALRDTGRVLDSAGEWASFQGDQHAGGFLKDTWLRVLLLLVALVIVLLAARLGRRRVDRWIERKLAGYSEMDIPGASVREELERARERRDAADTAASETSADDVLQQVQEAPPLGTDADAGGERPR